MRKEGQNHLDLVGFRGIYINSVLMSIVYAVPIAIMPVFIFNKSDSEGEKTPELASKNSERK